MSPVALSSAWTLLRGGIYDHISHIYPAPQCLPPSSSPSPSQEGPPTHMWPDWPGYMFFVCIQLSSVEVEGAAHTLLDRGREDVMFQWRKLQPYYFISLLWWSHTFICYVQKNSYVDVEGCTGTQVVLSRSSGRERWYNKGNVCILFHKPALLRRPVIIQIIL